MTDDVEPNEDTFECEGCRRIFDIEDSVKHGKKGAMYCAKCDKELKKK